MDQLIGKYPPMTRDQVRELFLGRTLIKEGETVVGWGMRETELISRGYSKQTLRKWAKDGYVEKIQCGTQAILLGSQVINVWVFKEPTSLEPLTVTE